MIEIGLSIGQHHTSSSKLTAWHHQFQFDWSPKKQFLLYALWQLILTLVAIPLATKRVEWEFKLAFVNCKFYTYYPISYVFYSILQSTVMQATIHYYHDYCIVRAKQCNPEFHIELWNFTFYQYQKRMNNNSE